MELKLSSSLYCGSANTLWLRVTIGVFIYYYFVCQKSSSTLSSMDYFDSYGTSEKRPLGSFKSTCLFDTFVTSRRCSISN